MRLPLAPKLPALPKAPATWVGVAWDDSVDGWVVTVYRAGPIPERHDFRADHEGAEEFAARLVGCKVS